MSGFDAFLELANEAGDVFLAIQLYNNGQETLFWISLASIVIECLLRIAIIFVVPSGKYTCWSCVPIPAWRKWKKGDGSQSPFFLQVTFWSKFFLALIFMLIEPNLGEKVLESMTVAETDRQASAGANEETQQFYEVYNRSLRELSVRELLLFLFFIEDVPEVRPIKGIVDRLPMHKTLNS